LITLGVSKNQDRLIKTYVSLPYPIYVFLEGKAKGKKLVEILRDLIFEGMKTKGWIGEDGLLTEIHDS